MDKIQPEADATARRSRPQTAGSASSGHNARKQGFFSRMFGASISREPSRSSSASTNSLRPSSSMANLFRRSDAHSSQEQHTSSRAVSRGNDEPILNPSGPQLADAELIVSSMHGNQQADPEPYRLETPLIAQGRFSWGEPFADSQAYSPLIPDEHNGSEGGETFELANRRDHSPRRVSTIQGPTDPHHEIAGQGLPSPYVGPRTASLDNLEAAYLAKAQALYDCTDPIAPTEYAVFLGTDLVFNTGVRRAFMSLFDFSGLGILKALRLLCSKLFIRGETQLLDRVIEAFAERWHICNRDQEGRWLSQDVAYILAFALITLNTDLHVANHDGGERKMKRSEFVNNTLTAIRAGTSHTVPVRQAPRRHDSVRSSTDNTEVPQVQSTIRVVRSASQATVDQEAAFERQETARRAAELDAWRQPPKTHLAMETYIKEILTDAYTSVNREQIRQPFLQRGSESEASPAREGTVSAFELRHGSAASMIRSSSSTSHISQLYRRASVSRDSRLNTARKQTLQPPPVCSVGFVGTLNNTIREERSPQVEAAFPSTDIADKLVLQGAPFAKEGRLYHSLYQSASTFGTLTKRASAAPLKLKGWSQELFGVVEKGHFCLFDLTTRPALSTEGADDMVGGGDWTRNARLVLEEPLNQAVAFKLSTKAYKDHPDVWSLTTAGGQRHAFSTGTQELVDEWVMTANYWAARVSKEPLLGAVGSAEYGWGDMMASLMAELDDSTATVPRSSGGGRPKLQAPGDAAVLQEWRPEPASTMTSALPVPEQLANLIRYLAAIREELTQLQAKQAWIPQLFSPKSDNCRRAKLNFELRSQALRKDIVKYEAYIVALRQGLYIEERLKSGKTNASSARASAKSASIAASH